MNQTPSPWKKIIRWGIPLLLLGLLIFYLVAAHTRLQAVRVTAAPDRSGAARIRSRLPARGLVAPDLTLCSRRGLYFVSSDSFVRLVYELTSDDGSTHSGELHLTPAQLSLTAADHGHFRYAVRAPELDALLAETLAAAGFQLQFELEPAFCEAGMADVIEWELGARATIADRQRWEDGLATAPPAADQP